jgi:hypothetical protein
LYKNVQEQNVHRNASSHAFSESLRPVPCENKRRGRLALNDAQRST